jgi:UDP-N-acetylglucosamine enolpyruvyl transferase
LLVAVPRWVVSTIDGSKNTVPRLIVAPALANDPSRITNVDDVDDIDDIDDITGTDRCGRRRSARGRTNGRVSSDPRDGRP